MKKLLLLFLIISQYSIAQITGSCTTCPPSGVGNSGKVLTSNGSKKAVYATVSAQTLIGANGVTISGDSVVLGGTLTQPTNIIFGENQLFLTNDSFGVSNKLFKINTDESNVYEAESLSDSLSFGSGLNSTGFFATLLRGDGERIEIKLDSISATFTIDYGNFRYHTGSFDNDGNKQNIDAELSCFQQDSLRDVSGIFARPSLVHISACDTLDIVGGYDGGNIYVTDDFVRTDFEAPYLGDSFATRLQQDTSFHFAFDSSHANMDVFYNNDTIHVNSNKPVVFNNLSVNKFTTADSATIYATTPPPGTTYYCSNCSGSGVTGRIVSYFGSLWRRLRFD